MKIEVDLYEKIRYLYTQEQLSQREISRRLGVSRKTVKKYCEGSAVPWERNGCSGRTAYVITDDVIHFIEACLLEDEQEKIKKQRHTSKRIYDRLVEGLVGWIRRNVLVPIPRVTSIDELNTSILQRCIAYRKHHIKGKEACVEEMATIDHAAFSPLAPYRFDSSKVMTTKVDEFSTVKFDYNYYSVPVRYVGKDISIKGFGNTISILYHKDEIACYTRSYTRNETFYTLGHYIDLLEKRPRSVYNAKPVKATISLQLTEIGKSLGNHRGMVKLLRLCVDYGELNVINAARRIVNQEMLSIDQIRAYLLPTTNITPLPVSEDITVKSTNLSKYDKLMQEAAI